MAHRTFPHYCIRHQFATKRCVQSSPNWEGLGKQCISRPRVRVRAFHACHVSAPGGRIRHNQDAGACARNRVIRLCLSEILCPTCFSCRCPICCALNSRVALAYVPSIALRQARKWRPRNASLKWHCVHRRDGPPAQNGATRSRDPSISALEIVARSRRWRRRDGCWGVGSNRRYSLSSVEKDQDARTGAAGTSAAIDGQYATPRGADGTLCSPLRLHSSTR